MTGASDVTAVVVAWNGRELLRDCLRSLAEHAPRGRAMEIVVVDNGSTDGSAELVRSEFPHVRLIANSDNLGYTRANNQAIRASTGRHLLLINADARLLPGCADALLARLDAEPRTAIVGPRLVYGDGSWQRWTAGRAPSLTSALVHHLFIDRFTHARGMYLSRDVRGPVEVDWVSSACLVARRDAVETAGLMDERFFVYMDDVDLCQRVRDLGWVVRYEPAAECVHLMGRTTRPSPGSIAPEAMRSFHRYFELRHGAGATLALRAIETTGFAARVALYLVGSLARGDPSARSKARMHLAYLRLALGLDRAHR